ncbi:MAG: nuclear transport factor 2 family protein [Acidimicrobiia bacterium]
MARDRELQELLDKQAVHEVVLRYCRGVDRMDRELVRGCYHADATDEHGTFVGTPDDYIEWAFDAVAKFEVTMHVVANHLCEIDAGDPDLAFAETYGLAYHQGPPADDKRRNFVTGFRFVDRFERRNGEWRIASRVTVREWTHQITPDQQWHIKPDRDGRRGARDRTDAVYTIRLEHS